MGFPVGQTVSLLYRSVFYTEWRDKDERIIERMLFDHSNDGDENYNVAGKEENKAIIEEFAPRFAENAECYTWRYDRERFSENYR